MEDHGWANKTLQNDTILLASTLLHTYVFYVEQASFTQQMLIS